MAVVYSLCAIVVVCEVQVYRRSNLVDMIEIKGNECRSTHSNSNFVIPQSPLPRTITEVEHHKPPKPNSCRL